MLFLLFLVGDIHQIGKLAGRVIGAAVPFFSFQEVASSRTTTSPNNIPGSPSSPLPSLTVVTRTRTRQTHHSVPVDPFRTADDDYLPFSLPILISSICEYPLNPAASAAATFNAHFQLFGTNNPDSPVTQLRPLSPLSLFTFFGATPISSTLNPTT